MNSSEAAGKKTIYLYAAYLSTVGLFVLGALFPDSRLWGVNFGAFVPRSLSISLLIIALIIFYLSYRLSQRCEDNLISDKTFTRFALLTSPIFVCGWIMLRVRTFFLGDGYTLLDNLANNEAIIKNREIGESLFHLWLKQILPASSETAALLSFQIISIGAGILFLILLTLATLRLFDSPIRRRLFWLGCATGGYSLLYFGYVEYYSLFITCVAAFVLIGLLIARSKLNRWLILVPLTLAIFFHSIGVALIPGALYLILTSDKEGRLLKNMSVRLKKFLALLGAIFSVSSLMYLYNTNFFFKLAIIPIFENEITAEGYTLFSANHLVDFANQLLLLFPGLLVVGCAALLTKRAEPLSREIRFLLVAVLSSLGAIFILDPRLGMPRDWDLFAFAGLPLVVAGYYYLLTTTMATAQSMKIGVMAIGLALVSLVGRAVVLSDVDLGVAQLKSHISLDKIKNRNGQAILVIYYQDIGDKYNAMIEESRRHKLYPQIAWVDTSKAQIERGRVDLAFPLLKKVIAIDPLYWNAWINLGACYLQTKQFDSAQIVSNIAVGLNPYNLEAQSQTAYAHYFLKQHDRAEKIWQKLLTRDSLHAGALVGMANISYARKDKSKYFHYLSQAASSPDALPTVVAQLGYFYIGEFEYKKAARVLRRALAMGLDTTKVITLFKNNPQLVNEMPELAN